SCPPPPGGHHPGIAVYVEPMTEILGKDITMKRTQPVWTPPHQDQGSHPPLLSNQGCFAGNYRYILDLRDTAGEAVA
ncbi:MAG TPA: hypothetical protein VN203_01930, partial [Candidatus Acidoferrum sp.]|nr:hypothetical protein [Candidatus Acidoferrum sp.]